MRSSTASGSLRVTIDAGVSCGFGIAFGGDRRDPAGRDSALFNRCSHHTARFARVRATNLILFPSRWRDKTKLPGGMRGRCWPLVLVRDAAAAGPRCRRRRTGPVSGLPIPRFVSLKSDRVNVRAGPNKDQDVRWVYTHAGMPVEITAEFENWRRIRDWKAPRAGSITRCCPASARRSFAEVEGRIGRRSTQCERRSGDVAAQLQSGVCWAAFKSCDGSGAVSPARALTVRCRRSGCGAPIRTRRWNNAFGRHHSLMRMGQNDSAISSFAA